MQELLGVEVPDDARGVLQDVHWTRASYGYFPTYALGNALSVQIWRAVEQELPDLDAQLEAGEFGAAVRVAPRAALPARPQVHADGDARARDRRRRDRPAAVPRVPARQGRQPASPSASSRPQSRVHHTLGAPVRRLRDVEDVLLRSQALVESFEAVVRAELPAGRRDLRRARPSRHRHRRDDRRLRRAGRGPAAVRDLGRVHVLPRRARPAPGLQRRERPHARLRGALGRALHPVRPARPDRGSDRARPRAASMRARAGSSCTRAPRSSS